MSKMRAYTGRSASWASVRSSSSVGITPLKVRRSSSVASNWAVSTSDSSADSR